MIKQSKLLFGFIFLMALSLGFYSCDKETTTPVAPTTDKVSALDQYMADHTQSIQVADLGEGTYHAVGEQGTIIEINNALVNAAGERVRGEIEIQLIEIYSVKDMILLQKQTMADYDGELNILESGGEVFIKVFQDGEELSVDGQGDMRLLLPTENTGGAREGMELFYGEETGDQVIWKPTGEKVRVVRLSNRNDAAYYQALIEQILGWINIDILANLQGEPVECVDLYIDCPDFCEITMDNSYANIYVNSLNSAFGMDNLGGGRFQLCGNWPLGGITVTFVVVIECDGQLFVAIVTATITPGSHMQIITCDDIQLMDVGTFEETLLLMAQ
ncbi:MAG: hypothetical protein AAGG75_27665 [Bacteroidota bacterium]